MARESSRSCDICSESRNAEYRCVECQQYYCSPCKSLHGKMAGCSRHNMLPFSAATASQQDQRTLARKCSKHDFQREIFFCTVCDTTVCPHCKATSHEGHATEDASDSASKARQELKEMETEIRKKIRLIEAEQADTERSRKQLRAEHSYVDSLLKKRAEQVRNWVDQVVEESLSGATELNSIFEENLRQAQEDSRCKIAALSARAQHISGILSGDDSAEALKLLADLKATDTSDEAGHHMRPAVTTLSSGDGQAENPPNFLILHQDDDVTFRSALQSYVGFVSSSVALRSLPVSYIESSKAFASAVRPTAAPNSESCGSPANVASSGMYQPPSIAGKDVANRPYASVFRHHLLPDGTQLEDFKCASNPETLITVICLTASNKLWVKCKPPKTASESMEMLKVFDISGRQLGSWPTSSMAGRSLFCVGDTLVSPQHWHWFKPTGENGRLNNPVNSLALSSKSCPPYVLLFDDSSHRYKMNIVQVLSLRPLHLQLKPVCGESVQLKEKPVCFDVSQDGTVFCFCFGVTVAVYHLNRQNTSTVFELFATVAVTGYSSDIIDDINFITLKNRELLLLLRRYIYDKKTSHRLFICDQHDGMHNLFEEHILADKTCSTFTVHPEGRVWLGFKGGEIVTRAVGQFKLK